MTERKMRPNIVFFFTDDQRFDTLHALGNEQVHTPTMDSWVRSGTTFTHAHIMGGTSGAVCMPSRAMLMTGRTLFHLEAEGQDIPANHVLLGETLQQAGYRTFGTGKWHNGPSSYARSFTDGAEIFFGGMEDHWNVPACDFDPTGRYDTVHPAVRNAFYSNEVVQRRCDHITPGKHSSELFCEAAIDFIQGYDSDQPFFVYISFMAPHDPRTMPKEFLDLYDPDQIELPPNWMPEHPFDNGALDIRDELLAAHPRTEAEIRRHIAEYYAMITHADAQMGKVIQALEAKGVLDNTIIIFAGDNGLALGQHGLMGKQSMYEHSIRVPLVFCGPGIPQGKQSNAFCYLFDIYPTLCDLIDIPPANTIEGKSLRPAMYDDDPIRDTMYFAYTGLHRCVRDRRFKLIEYAVNGERTTQLFDMEADPWELHNLAGNAVYAKDLARLRSLLIRSGQVLEYPYYKFTKAFWDTFKNSPVSLPTIGRYEIEGELGSGGMASVFLGRDPYMLRQVAVKVLALRLTEDELVRDLFHQEAEVIAALEHPCIVPVFDFGWYGSQPYIVTRYMAGGTLEDKLAEGRLKLAELSHIIDRVAEGLDAAHAQGIIHRDVKPSNILFDHSGEAFLADFGLAKSLAQPVAQDDQLFVGTPEYMSPEQVRGEELDGRSDIYALGVVLYRVLAEQVPYRGATSIATAEAHIDQPVPDIKAIRPDLPSTWGEVIGKAMAKNREDRYATASDLALDVREIVSGKWFLRKLTKS